MVARGHVPAPMRTSGSSLCCALRHCPSLRRPTVTSSIAHRPAVHSIALFHPTICEEHILSDVPERRDDPRRRSWVGDWRQRPFGGCSSPAVNVSQSVLKTELVRRPVANHSPCPDSAERRSRRSLRCTSFRVPLTVPAVARSCRYIVICRVRLSVPEGRDSARGLPPVSG